MPTFLNYKLSDKNIYLATLWGCTTELNANVLTVTTPKCWCWAVTMFMLQWTMFSYGLACEQAS